MRLVSFSLAMLMIAGPATAESNDLCLARWKAADLDANGAYDATKDSADYSQALAGEAQPVSKDRFLEMCRGGRFVSLNEPSNPAQPRDLGKGDLTPGKPLGKDDVMTRLRAQGYSDIKNLALDDKGVWHGEAEAGGRRVKVAIDPQGDIISR